MKLSKLSRLVAVLVAVTAPVQALDSGGSARVARVIDGDTLVLETPIYGATHVRLVGVQAPELPHERDGFKKHPLAEEARAALEKMTLGRTVDLHFGGRRADRYGRLLAHLYVDGKDWVQGRLLEDGMVRVYSFADNRALVANMLKVEKTARDAGRGVWGNGAYAIRSLAETPGLIGTFQLVEGTVRDAATVKGRTYLNFGADWRSDFTISIDGKARRLFTKAGLDPLTLKGKKLRVRGWLRKRNGPMIDASHPEQIEVLSK
ncbi:MAG: thermonuclease family protein [Alphaproteobacteria bacterium]